MLSKSLKNGYKIMTSCYSWKAHPCNLGAGIRAMLSNYLKNMVIFI